MNTKLIAFAIGFASIAAHAAGTDATPALDTVTAHTGPKLIVECRDERLPGYASVGAVLDTNNSTVLYAARESMRRTVQHACAHGMGHVAFVPQQDSPRDALVLAAHVTP